MNEESKLYSVSQIAEELSITKQALYQRIKTDDELSTELSQFKVSKGKFTLYTEQGKALIISKFDETRMNRVKSIESKQESKVKSIESQLIDTLQSQIDDLRKQVDILTAQLTAKDNQIQALQQTILSLSDSLAVTNTALTQAQTLHALTIKADSEADAGEPTATEQAEEPQEKKKGFFSRFKRK